MSEHVDQSDPAWSSMTKRVAIEIAIVRARGGSLLEEAGAAIKAMREPTDAMTGAGAPVPSDTLLVDQVGPGGAACVWRVMIDEALK